MYSHISWCMSPIFQVSQAHPGAKQPHKISHSFLKSQIPKEDRQDKSYNAPQRLVPPPPIAHLLPQSVAPTTSTTSLSPHNLTACVARLTLPVPSPAYQDFLDLSASTEFPIGFENGLVAVRTWQTALLAIE